jgi:hypothetical protein
MGILGIIWGILAMIGAMIAFPPFLGALNWINVPFSIIGVIFSAFAVGNDKTRSQGITGLVLASAAIGIGVTRLMIGWGII